MAVASHPRRRRYRRLTVRIDVSFLCEEDGSVHSAVATTLGAGGLFIPSETPLPAGTPLRVRLRLPGTEVDHELSGRVVWANDRNTPGVPASGRGMGIAFKDRPGIVRLARALETWVAEGNAVPAPDWEPED